MKDGDYEFYTIQHNRVGESKWGTVSPIKYRNWPPNDDWNYSSWDFFIFSLRPKLRGGYSLKPVNVVADKEVDEVRNYTGRNGWWSIKFARAALKRLRSADDRGDHDSIDPGFERKRMQAIRHDFRIVKLRVSQFTEVKDVCQWNRRRALTKKEKNAF